MSNGRTGVCSLERNIDKALNELTIAENNLNRAIGDCFLMNDEYTARKVMSIMYRVNEIKAELDTFIHDVIKDRLDNLNETE